MTAEAASTGSQVEETAPRSRLRVRRLSKRYGNVQALDEVDFGDWNGRSFAELEEDPLWHEWNSRRATAATPGGERMGEAVARTVAHLEQAATGPNQGPVMLVTHCDIIRGVIAFYLGLSLDHILRFDIDPGSVSTIEVGAGQARIIRINEVPA